MSKINVISRSDGVFADRREAGRLLGAALKDFRGDGTVVLGIPRGGVVVAKEVSDILNAILSHLIAFLLLSQYTFAVLSLAHPCNKLILTGYDGANAIRC